MQSTWILVADAAHGRIFSTQDGRTIDEVANLAHPAARQHDRDLASDRPGRSFDSAGQGRHAMEPEHHPHDQEAEEFALELANALEAGRNQHRYKRLVLVAPPEFLGRLRKHLHKDTARMVLAEIDKDLVHLDEAALLAYIKEHL